MRTNLIKNNTVTTIKSNSTSIHLIHVLDVSGSMMGEKGKAALQGIKQEILDIRKESLGINYKYSLIIFSNFHKYIYYNTDINLLNISKLDAIIFEGMTGLYDVLGTILTKEESTKDTKTLIKIFTDGMENCSTNHNSKTIESLIKNREASGWVITFIGTKVDTKTIISKLGIRKDNTLTHINTAKSIATAFTLSNTARILYSKAVLDGTDDNISFYKSINTDTIT